MNMEHSKSPLRQTEFRLVGMTRQVVRTPIPPTAGERAARPYPAGNNRFTVSRTSSSQRARCSGVLVTITPNIRR